MKETVVVPMQFVMANEGLLKIDRVGAGVGVLIYSRANKTGAGVHVLRANASGGQNANPVSCADTVIPYVMQQFEEKGVVPPFSIAMVGGASLMNMPKNEGMGQQLVDELKKNLSEANLQVKVEETGGNKVRSIVLDVEKGKIVIE